MLTNDLVLIQDYDSSWPDVFSRLASRVKAALGDLVLTVEHVGSTAIPGMSAKPIIDMDIILERNALTLTKERLASIGYVHQGVYYVVWLDRNHVCY